MSSAPQDNARLQQDARDKYRRDKKNNANFWRATRYLKPYLWMVIGSTVCAFFVGLTTTTGLGTMLPIIRVLINGDTVPAWVDRHIVDSRLGIKLADDPHLLRIITLDNGVAKQVGFRAGDDLQGNRPPGEVMHELADPDKDRATCPVPGQGMSTLSLPRVPGYLRWARNIAAMLPADPVWAIAAVFGILALLAVIGNTIKFFQEYLSNKAAILAVNDIRRHLYDHVLRIPLGRFGEQGTSDVTSRLVQDSSNLQDGFNTVLGQSIQEPIKAAMAFVLALILSWKLTLFIVAFGPIMALIIRKFGKKMRRSSRKALQESSSMLGQLESTLIGIRVVKASGAERFERRRYGSIMNRLVDEQLRMSRIDAYSTPVMETITLLVAGCVVIFAAYLVLKRKTLDPDNFIVVMIALASIGESLRRCSKVVNALQKSNAAAARIFETMDTPVERDRKKERASDEAAGRVREGRIKLPDLTREIIFDSVSFAYPNANSRALSDLSLVVPKGQSVAVVGGNGSGKTTLLALLPRFHDPQSGRILIDGVDIRRVTLRSLRRQISIVTQDSVIFPGTIAENIAYGHPLAPKLAAPSESITALRHEIESSARRAFAHDFIMEKPQGYDTLLGELGGQLSGGQKQRICIARAILRKSPILILDEATSQVDAESEHLIHMAIETLMHERTTFVIAHRFSTIKSADTIVVLDRGQVVGQGKHDELLATCPRYQQLYERQIFGAGVAAAPAV